MKREDASDGLMNEREQHTRTHMLATNGLGSLHIMQKEGGTDSHRTPLTQFYAFGPNQLTRTLEGSHATRIRLAQKSLSITLPLS